MENTKKVVYVSDDLNNVIYGGEEPAVEVETVKEPAVQDIAVEVETDDVEDVAVKVETDVAVDVEKVDEVEVEDDAEPIKVENDEPVKDDDEPIKVEEDIEVVEVVDDVDDADANKMSGGEYDDDASSRSSDDVSSLSTTDLLRVDPLYFRLTKFLQTSGNDGSEPQNVAEILKQINMNLEKMTELMTKYVSQNEKQV